MKAEHMNVAEHIYLYLNPSVCIWTVVLNVELTTSSSLSFDNVSPQSFSALPLLTFWVRCQMVCCGRVGFYFILAWLVVSLSSALYASDILHVLKLKTLADVPNVWWTKLPHSHHMSGTTLDALVQITSGLKLC